MKKASAFFMGSPAPPPLRASPCGGGGCLNCQHALRQMAPFFLPWLLQEFLQGREVVLQVGFKVGLRLGFFFFLPLQAGGGLFF